MKTTTVLIALAAGFAAVKLFGKKCKNTDEISLENLRMGIANQWYSVSLFAGSKGKYFAILIGKDTDGVELQTTKEISKETFDALKADGVPQRI